MPASRQSATASWWRRRSVGWSPPKRMPRSSSCTTSRRAASCIRPPPIRSGAAALRAEAVQEPDRFEDGQDRERPGGDGVPDPGGVAPAGGEGIAHARDYRRARGAVRGDVQNPGRPGNPPPAGRARCSSTPRALAPRRPTAPGTRRGGQAVRSGRRAGRAARGAGPRGVDRPGDRVQVARRSARPPWAVIQPSTCSASRAPTIAPVTPGHASVQATATAATDVPCASAIGTIASRSARLRERRGSANTSGIPWRQSLGSRRGRPLALKRSVSSPDIIGL